MLAKYPVLSERAGKAGRMVEGHRILITLGFRFLYGLRTAIPFAIHMSHIRVIEFVLLNIVGAAIWATVIGALGYSFGHSLELLLGDIKRYETDLFLLVALTGILTGIIRMVRARRKRELN